MKKIYLFLLVIFGYTAFAQQKGISYQAVIINPKAIAAPGYNGTSIPLSNKAICLSFQIVNGTNQVEYQESQSITTDLYGMVNVVIGTGNTGTGLVTSLDAVNWSQGAKKLVVSVNTEGVCSNYTEISNQLLNYTPYSFYAQNADIKDGYVTTAKLADGAVTDPKVAMGINPAKVGLGNVNNTSDANKPVSTATQTALNLKANLASPTFTGTVSGIDKTMVGLGNVDNTTDTNKPISTATQTALDLKANATDVTTSLALKEDVSNKSNAPIGTSTTLYPTQNAVKTYVDSSIADATIVDADTATKGKIKLSGDLAGTADLPTVPGLALKANVADVTTSLALKEEVSNKSNASLGTSTTLYPTQNAVKTYVDTTIATVNANATALQATVTANAITATTAIAAVQADVDANETTATTALATKENAVNKSTTTTLGNSDVLFPTQNAVKTYVDSQVATATIADANATTKGKIKLAGDLAGTADLPTVPGLALKADTSSLSTVAISGNYNDLTNKPIIPSSFTLPTATASVLGGVKVGANLSIDANGVLNAIGGNSVSSVTGVLPIANGGTGAITVAGIKSILGLNTSRIAIGDQAGQTNQSDAIALGIGAGNTDQSGAAIAIGGAAGATNQGNTSVSIGSNAGQASQGAKAVAIGFAAGQNNQGTNSVAIGAFAGNAQAANSIALNATGSLLNPQTSGFFVAPVRNASESNSLFYNTTTKEITYGTAAPTGPLNLATGVTGILPITNGGTGATTATGALTNLGAAPLASPIFTGTPAAPTASAGSNTTQIATTEFVTGAVALATINDATTSAKGKIQLAGDLGGTAAAPTVPGLALKAPIASPTFTGTVTAPIYASLPQSLTDAATIAWDPANGLNANVTLGGNRTLSFTTTPTAGSYGTLIVTQDATGGRTLTLPSTVTNKVLGSTSTTTVALSSAANAKDILNFYFDGTNCYWNIGQGYGTAATAAITNLATSVSGTLPVANGGTGAATLTGLIKGNGTGAMTAATAGTDYLAPNGSAANLTNFPTLNQNTTGNAATATTATSATNVTGTVAVANGGTGATSLTANNVLLGNGTSALQVVAPGTSGNVLTSNGTTWSSSAPAASGVPYTGATQAVNLGAYDLTVNGLTVGKGKKDVAGTAYQYNSAFGVSALGSFTGGTKNTALGFNALSSVTSTDQNIAIGAYAMGSTTDYFQQSVAVGNQSLLYNKGSFNTALGSGAISSQNLTSAATYLVGVGALALLNNSSGQNNTAIGSYALSTNTTGNNNTALGQGADVNSATLDNATAIGYDAKVSTSNSIQLGNTSVTNVKTSGTVTAGTVTYPNTHGTANQVLSTTGSGTLAWVTPVNSAASFSGTLAVANGGNGLSTTPANGQIDIGNGTGFTRTTLTAGTAITITNTAGAITISAAVRPTTDQFTATTAQTIFTVTQTPLNTKVWMFINGIRTNNLAYSVSGTTVTYTAANNNGYALVAGDRIQFDYAY